MTRVKLVLVFLVVLSSCVVTPSSPFQLGPANNMLRQPPKPSSVRLKAFFGSNRNLECELTYENQYMPTNCDPDFDEAFTRPESMDLESILNIVLPIVTPIVSFLTYEEIAELFSWSIDVLGPGNWVAVDGGEYQSRIIAPAINGVVVPSMAVLFATLTSTTISSLRDRQVHVRQAINMEAGELRALECLLEAFPNGILKERSREYLIQYTSRIIAECSPMLRSGDQVTNPRRGMDSELNAFINVLNQQSDTIPQGFVLSEAFSSVSKLREQRQTRITALQSTFPSLHYMILGVLAFGICTAFLIETNSKSQIFLNALQLKILWSMLTGTFASCFAVFSDLGAPFAGSYQILASVDQLYLIRLTLQASARMDQINEEKIKNGIEMASESSMTTTQGMPLPIEATRETDLLNSELFTKSVNGSEFINRVKGS